MYKCGFDPAICQLNFHGLKFLGFANIIVVVLHIGIIRLHREIQHLKTVKITSRDIFVIWLM